MSGVARWSCNNEPWLDLAQDAAIAVAVVAGLIVVAPAIPASVFVAGAAFGGVMSFWTCDQSENGWWRPGGFSDLDTSCVSAEIALGAVFAPVGGAATSRVARRVAVACAWGALEGGTSTAAHMTFVDEDEAFNFADASKGAGIGCVTAGVLEGSFGTLFRNADDVRPARVVDCNSFPTGTLVLMADGAHKSIDQIMPGEQVLAYHTDEGTWAPQIVLDQWSHLDTGEMVTVTLEDGSTVSATDHHLFWVESEHVWVQADDLEPGDVLADPDSSPVVSNVSYWPQGDTLVWELTVDNVHTFAVSTGAADVVVHNAGSCFPADVNFSTDTRTHVLNGILGKRAGGFHHRPGGVTPSGNEILDVTAAFDSGSLAGVYQAQVRICRNGRCIEKFSTFFPDSWSSSRVLDEIASAYRIKLASGNIQVGFNTSRSSSGFPIAFVLDEVGELITAFPAIA